MVSTRARLDPSHGRFWEFATGSHFLMNHENSAFVPSCLCGGTDLWQIYGGAKGGNPVSMLDRVCNGLPWALVTRNSVLAVLRTRPCGSVVISPDGDGRIWTDEVIHYNADAERYAGYDAD